MKTWSKLRRIAALLLVSAFVLTIFPTHAKDEGELTNQSEAGEVYYSDFITLDDLDLQAGTFNLNKLLQDAALIDADGNACASGTDWTIERDHQYRIKLTFRETAGNAARQFPNGDTPMVYTLPEGLDFAYTVSGGSAAVQTGAGVAYANYTCDAEARTVTFNWNTDGEAFTALRNQGDAAFDVTLDVKFTGRGTTINFSDTLAATLHTDDSGRFLTARGEDYTLRLYPFSWKGLPEDVSAGIREIRDDGTYRQRVADQLGIGTNEIEFLRVFDIAIRADENVAVEAEGPVRIEMDMPVAGERITAVHFHRPTTEPTVVEEEVRGRRTTKKMMASAEQVDILPVDVAGNTLQFATDSFSIFAVVGYTLEKRVMASDGNTYLITVTYDADACIPEGASLEAYEILPEEENQNGVGLYQQYVDRVETALGYEAGSVRYARFFDISIIDEAGETVQPAEGSKVSVSIRLDDKAEDTETRVLHFGDNLDILSSETAGNTVTFEAEGFSVYAIVDAPEPVTFETIASKMDDITSSRGQEGFILSIILNGKEKFFTSTISTKGALDEVEQIGQAADWFFEPVEGNDLYKIYTLSGNNKQYIHQKGNGNEIELSEIGSVFQVVSIANKRFRIKLDGTGKYLQHSGTANGIRLYDGTGSALNSQIKLTFSAPPPSDPYNLNGCSFGIAYHNDTTIAAALKAESKSVGNQQRLAADDLVMKPDALDNNGILLVANNSDITEWTFEAITEDKYYISTTVDGAKKYLTINGANVTLEDEPDPVKSVIRAIPGTGENAGKWHFTVGNNSLNLPSGSGNGFNAAGGNGATTWLNLVEKSVLNDNDFKQYNAKKVSVSDTENVYNGQQVVIYTRIWNDATKKYEFYVVDHNGSLARCYDTGDSIEWVGTNVNTAVWNFTEYYDTPTGEYEEGSLPNYYYELQNTQYGNYIAPQISNNQFSSGSKIGINLNGRRYGQNYTTIIAWDQRKYSFSGLKVENGHVVPCALSEAEDFYFAIVNPVDPDDRLSTVETVDNNIHGISMRMIDYNNPIQNERDSGQTSVLGLNTDVAGLLTTNLINGYPETVTEKTGKNSVSLATLYGDTTSANHLFLQSIYNESGYFEYDSTQNFAHLEDNGNFTVYDQIAAISTNGTPGKTRTHGQFMPYNMIEAGKYALFNNQTDVLEQELSDFDPRKDEKLYLIPLNDADYFFGMELEASFTQTPSGLDAWGHDIIFEFSGDDDFWLYVDGELVLDLGGVHKAMTGSVNFRTGTITTNKRGNSTLYEVFRNNYTARGLSENEINSKLDEIFEQNSAGQYVFKDYSNHDMKIFYMERGAGASNLHMRFNLAAVKPGSVELSKKLSGTDSTSNKLIEFPYQIWYTLKADGGATNYLLTEKSGSGESEKYNVLYKDSINSVTYRDSIEIGGTTYPNVFFLKPGETAVIDLPDNTANYWITECGVNTAAYDSVKVNGETVTGTGDGVRKDFTTSRAAMEDRPSVEYDNHVSDGAMRTLEVTKQLYDTDGERIVDYSENKTLFNLRLYLGNEFASSDSLPAADQYTYFVKDKDGHYCRWNDAQQIFEPLGYTNYSDLSAYLATLSSVERESIAFVTSMNGSITNIPVQHTVEVRELIVGTQWKVEERGSEIPRGYTIRIGDGYYRTDNHTTTGDKPISGTMMSGDSPKVEVRNQKGWGLTVKKVWSDKDFMASHDPIYFAVYRKNSSNGYDLLGDTVRQLAGRTDEIYYFFLDLKDENQNLHRFDDYIIREVTISAQNPTVEDGVVTDYGTVTPIAEGGTLTIGGQPVGGSYQQDAFSYTVGYTTGEYTSHNENIREDTVTNSRPGIKLYKYDLDGQPLADAVFTLQDSEGNDVAARFYTSRASDGLITIAYLNPGTYTLMEVETPKGKIAVGEPIQITVNNNGTFSVSSSAMWDFVQATDSDMATIRIKNRPVSLEAVKIDFDKHEPIEGVHFALYHQVTDAEGKLRKDYNPIPGYEDLVTDVNGIIPNVTIDLNPGTYYLTETLPAVGYTKLTEDFCFTIGADGTVKVNSDGHANWLSVNTNADGKVAYRITIPNGMMPVNVTVAGTKILNGRDMEAGEFTFMMTPINSVGEAVGSTVTTTCEAGRAGEEKPFSFDLTYELDDFTNAAYKNEAGDALFYYLVEELVPFGVDDNGLNVANQIRYDQNKFLVVVRLWVDEQNQLQAEKTYYLYKGVDTLNSLPDELKPRQGTVNMFARSTRTAGAMP